MLLIIYVKMFFTLSVVTISYFDSAVKINILQSIIVIRINNTFVINIVGYEITFAFYFLSSPI